MQEQSYKSLEESILLILKRAEISSVSIAELLDILAEKSRALVLIFLSFPFCQPIQIPGLSTPLGIVIAFLGFRMAFRKRVWLPQKVLSKQIDSESLKKIAHKTLKMIQKMRSWIRPRLIWICQHPMMIVANGLMIAALGLFLALPLPIPFTNLVVAWPLLFIGIGLLEDDGLFVLIGYLMVLVSLIVLLLILLQVKRLYL